MRDYSKDFAEWRKWRDEKGLPPIYDNPADAGIETDFRVGQQVSFTNEYGVRFEPHVIMGFCKPEPVSYTHLAPNSPIKYSRTEFVALLEAERLQRAEIVGKYGQQEQAK